MAGTQRALVLSGGGPVGRAWQTGVAAAAMEDGLDLRAADLILGTSAGAIVGAEIALGRNLTTPPDAQPTAHQPSPKPDRTLMAMIAQAGTATDPDAARRNIGAAASAAITPSEAVALARPNIASMAGAAWPARFTATAVSVITGRLQLFSSASGASLQQALAASSALPGVWPPITIGADRYMDGGVCSSFNLTAVPDGARAIILSCHRADIASPRGAALADEISQYRGRGTPLLVEPAEEFFELTKAGTDLLNAALVAPAFAAGRRQWLEERDRVTTFWAASSAADFDADAASGKVGSCAH